MSTATELQAWLNGTPTGGPESDGRYPLTYADGLTYLVYCPEAQALNPALAEEAIEVFSNTASAAAATATAEAAEATQASIDAQTYAANALASKNAAATSATNALTSKNAAATSATTASTAATNAATSATAADASADAAAASAASIDLGDYYTKVASDARYPLIAHTHTFASLTSKPTTLAGYGITDAAASSHTHTFASLTSKPTTIAGYGITDVNWTNVASKPTTVAGFGITDGITDADVAEASTVSKIAKRNAAGDIAARLFRPEFGDQGTISGSMAYRINNTTDNFIRFCNSTVAIRTWLDVPATAHTHTMSDVTDLPAVAETTTGSTLAKRTSAGYLYATFFNTSGVVNTARPTNVCMEIGDGFIRRQALATFKNNIGLWVQSTDPGSAAAEGDLWAW